MARLRLTLACGDYDRTRALEDGTIRPDGIELTYLRLPVEETFFRMMRHREFEVAEMSLSSYVVSLQTDPAPFLALPDQTLSTMLAEGEIDALYTPRIPSPFAARHRWFAQSLYKAMLLAKREATASLYDSSALRFMLPWLNQDPWSRHAPSWGTTTGRTGSTPTLRPWRPSCGTTTSGACRRGC